MVATSGEVIVSSDHLLCHGVEPLEGEFEVLDRPFEGAVEPEIMRIGMRRVPLKEVPLSFLLRMEPDMLSLRGR